MYTKTSILALCAAASVNAAATGHRHGHPKREIVYAATDVVVVTDYVTVTVTAGEEPTLLAAAATAPEVSTTSTTASSIVESATADAATLDATTAAVFVTTAPVAEEPDAPAQTQTTLATVLKSSSVPVVESPVVSYPVESSSTAEVSTTETQVPTTTSTSSAASTSTTTPSTGSGTSKRGAAYNDPTLVTTLLGMSKEISWAYNWGSDSSGLKADIPYYPMLWSPASDHSSNWDTKAEAALSSGSDCLLSFNEPDQLDQANLSPAAAASGHIQYMNPYAGRARISSPAITSNTQAGHGTDWLGQFFTACDGKCQVDFCAAHWYGPGGQEGADLFLTHVKNVHTACENKPVWITEFEALTGDIDAFMTAIVEALDSDEYSFVEKYSYFMLSQGNLMTSTTELSSFGKIYASVS